MPTKILSDIVLADFLEVALGSTSFVTIPPTIAKAIVECDTDESQCHIEWPNEQNELRRPQLWRIEDWRTSHARYVRRKTLADKERSIAVRASELRVAIGRKLMAATGCDEQMLQPLINELVRTRNVNGAGLYGINLQPLLDADDELTQFKQQNNIK